MQENRKSGLTFTMKFPVFHGQIERRKDGRNSVDEAI